MDHVIKAAGGTAGRVLCNNQQVLISAHDHDDQDQDIQEDMMMMMELRRGPWTVEEDFALINYIAHHGEGRWNSLARSAGLKRTGKSCRLRWLNYLRPDVRRGNITLEEQLLILELHSRWGNRWSKIAQHLPGRTDNEIKNYWRTRVQKHAKQLKCDVNSKQFKDTMRYLWMPRLVERIQAAAAAAAGAGAGSGASSSSTTTTATNNNPYNYQIQAGNITINNNNNRMVADTDGSGGQLAQLPQANLATSNYVSNMNKNIPSSSSSFTPENSSTTAASSDSFTAQFSPVSDLTDCFNYSAAVNQQQVNYNQMSSCYNGDQTTSMTSPTAGYFNMSQLGVDFQLGVDQNMMMNSTAAWSSMDGGDASDCSLWNAEDVWLLQQHLNIHNNTFN